MSDEVEEQTLSGWDLAVMASSLLARLVLTATLLYLVVVLVFG